MVLQFALVHYMHLKGPVRAIQRVHAFSSLTLYPLPLCPVALLGDMFLRNVYSLYDFGNWTEAGDAGPFMQLLSVRKDDQQMFRGIDPPMSE